MIVDVFQFLDTSTEFLFGQSTISLLPETPFATDESMQAFNRALLGLALLLIFGPFRWFLYLDPWWKTAYKKVYKFVDRHVERALARQRSPTGNADAGGPKRYVLLEEMALTTQDPYELRMQIINVIFPARDTAAIAFGDIMFELARHPDEWELLRKEVLTSAINHSLSRLSDLCNEPRQSSTNPFACILQPHALAELH